MNWLGESEKSVLPKEAALRTLPDENEPALKMGAGWMPMKLVTLAGDAQKLWWSKELLLLKLLRED